MRYKNLTVIFSSHPDSLSNSEKFTNAELTTSGNHLIITEYENDDDDSSITGKLFNLNTLDSYKANNN